MTESGPESARTARSWDTYWHGIGDAGTCAVGGVSHPAIHAFWQAFFREAREEFEAPRILDIASGDGAVVAHALDAFAGRQADVTCLDVSAAAVRNVQQRFPGVRGVVADANGMPFGSGTFDIVTSQFGVEYAGPAAVDEAGRLLAQGGRLALVLHHRAGRMFRECTESLDAIARLRDSGFIPRAIDMLGAGFEASRGADRAPYEAAATRLAPAVKSLESVLRQYGEHVAGDTIVRLYSDVDHIHRHLQAYDPTEVLGWLRAIDASLDDYAGRMASMRDSAVDEASFDAACTGLQGRGHTLLRHEPLAAGDGGLPLGWILIAAR